MNWLSIVTSVLQIVPSIINVIKAIEEAIPGSGQGEQKLAAIREIIEATHEQAAILWPTLERVVSALVAVFNRTGVFAKSA